MVIKFLVQGGSGNIADVTNEGFLLTQSTRFSEPSKQSITDSNAVNFWKPMSGEKFIITGIIINTDRNVGVNGAVIDIYEADSEDSTVISKSILSLDQSKTITSPIFPLNSETTEGKYINGKASDFNVNITVFGYYVIVN